MNTTYKKADAYFLCGSREEADELMKKANRYAKERGFTVEGKYFNKKDGNPNLLDKIIASLPARNVKLLILSGRQALGNDEIIRSERRNNILNAGAKIMFLNAKRNKSYALYWLNTVRDYNSYALDWKIRIGAAAKPEQHRTTNGSIPYGYNSDKGFYTVNDGQAKNIRLIFDLYVSGMNASAIAGKLSGEGAERRFPASSILSMLQNEHYAGIDKGMPGTVPAIVTNKQWLNVAGRISQRRKREPAARLYLFDNVNFTEGRQRVKLKPAKAAGGFRTPFYLGSSENMNIALDAEKLENLIMEKLFENLPEFMDKECNSVLAFKKTKADEMLKYINKTQEQKKILQDKFNGAFPIVSNGQNMKRESVPEFDKLKASLDEINKKLRRSEIIMELCSQTDADIRDFFERAKQIPDMPAVTARFFINKLIYGINAAENEIIIDCNYNSGQKIVISAAQGIIKNCVKKARTV